MLLINPTNLASDLGCHHVIDRLQPKAQEQVLISATFADGQTILPALPKLQACPSKEVHIPPSPAAAAAAAAPAEVGHA